MSWWQTDAAGYGGQQRTISVNLWNPTETVLLGNISTQNVSFDDRDITWNQFATDVTALMQANEGTDVRLQFEVFIPEFFTGAAGLGIDDVSLGITVVPEPASLMLYGFGMLGLLGASRRRRCSKS